MLTTDAGATMIPLVVQEQVNLKLFGDYESRYLDATKETLVGLYARRNPNTGQPEETLNEIIHRVAYSVAIAELKYAFTPEQIINMSLVDAISHPVTQEWAQKFASHIGEQKFWANSPANINASPAIALSVLKYWAHGVLAGLAESDIWLQSEVLRRQFEQTVSTGSAVADFKDASAEHRFEMGKIASLIKGKGCLAACGVTFVEDNLESIQEAARTEALAAKAAMGMGLNTSSLRPWSTVISNGAAASGADRFYEKTIAKAVEAVAQGGRRGGALIELRNSDHPDILFFVQKKRLVAKPSLTAVFNELFEKAQSRPDESVLSLKKRIMALAETQYGELYAQYLERQNYLKNTNITVLAMPGFMESVQSRQFYPAMFNGSLWHEQLFDPRRPVIDDRSGSVKLNKLTKELVYQEYSVDLQEFPDALDAAKSLKHAQVEVSGDRVQVRGHFFAPDVFRRIIDGMRTSGEPGLAFYDHINEGNANKHIYDLNTCNPCGEQFLPAGRGKDGKFYMGTCNLSSMHAAHKEFWNDDNSYNYSKMAAVAELMQRFMDNVTDISWYPLPVQNMTARLERRNGGGFAGIAEFLSSLGLEFGSADAEVAVEELYRQFTKASFKASEALADERGVYPLWHGSVYDKKGQRVRNTCMTNNAPTGTLAQALQTSWGVDPHNGIVFSRKVRSRTVNFVAPGFAELMARHGAWPSHETNQNELMMRIRENGKSCRGLLDIPAAVQKAFPIRVEVDPEAYIRHLAAIHRGTQDYPETFNSVSNTCSIPLDMNESLVAQAVLLSYRLGVKDLTFYPDGSRLSQPVEQIGKDSLKSHADLLTILGHQEKRFVHVDETSGTTYKVQVGTPGGSSTLHVSLNHHVNSPGELIEVYARMGKPGAVESGLFEAVGRLASTFLQFAAQFGDAERASAEQLLVKQLINIQSGYPTFYRFNGDEKPNVIQSPCDGLARAILQYRKAFKAKQSAENIKTLVHQLSGAGLETKTDSAEVVHFEERFTASASAEIQFEQSISSLAHCSSCGNNDWLKIDGCFVCQSCGFSKCG
jgi:ribonucleotide reductase alpha subunit